ncbi:efflux RND transporter periplasmic adaptor subunit [Flavobacterium sp. JP2137]|uniref:efflux RND transporter periplasmic adaptor subunit n=1 Tax=Flavobacterium sp. JP2137 TaxID=3414510 RepID=UPI003D300E09
MYKTYLTYFALSLVLASSCQKTAAPTAAEKTPYCLTEDLKKTLQFEKISRSPIQETLSLTGNIQYDIDKTTPFVSLLDGVVTATYFSLGDYVKKGQLLAEIKSASLNELQDSHRSLTAQIGVAQRQLQSVQSMFNDGIASQKDLLEAQSELDLLRSNLQSNNSNMSLYSASSDKSVFSIKAPADGYIVSKNISPGMPISGADDELFTISNLSEVWVMANVYATNMRHVSPNMPVTVKTLAYPEETFDGKITSISQVFDQDERVLKAKIVMKNTDMKLKPGMSADIILALNASDRTALAIPNQALVFENNQNYVVVYKDDCTLELRLVKAVAKNDFYTYVDENLEEGESVVTKNQLLLLEEINHRSL